MNRFRLGRVVSTPGVLDLLTVGEMTTLLARHESGDWGDLDDEDKATNETAVQRGYRILSSYRLSDARNVWIITEADRSATTFLLPSEY